jgi:hypothetical protein
MAARGSSVTDSKAMRGPLPVHPLFFAIYPALFLFARNADLFPLRELVGPAVVLLALMLALWGALALTLRNRHLAAILATLSWMFFFSYGHLKNMLLWLTDYDFDLVRNRYLLPILVVIFLLVVVWFIQKRLQLHFWTRAFNVVGALLLIVSVLQIGVEQIAEGEPATDELLFDSGISDSRKPHIFYIILDGYAGEDVLRDVFALDNRPFYEALTQRGFFVTKHSHSNYCRTILSLASSLNLTYLDSLAATEPTDRMPLMRMIWDNRLSRVLKALGYERVVYAAASSTTGRFIADHYESPGLYPGQLGNALINLTPVPGLIAVLTPAVSHFQYDLHRRLILYPLKDMPRWAESEQPVFVFSHLLSPHPPFVWDQAGQPVNADRPFHLYDGDDFMRLGGTYEEYISGYRGQVRFINSRVLVLVDDIIARATRPTVIVLQADHGARIAGGEQVSMQSRMRNYFSIFNALRLPGVPDTVLYDRLSPVNNFRVVLDRYFDAKLPLLQDRSYFSTWEEIYQFEDVTNTISLTGWNGDETGRQ